VDLVETSANDHNTGTEVALSRETHAMKPTDARENKRTLVRTPPTLGIRKKMTASGDEVRHRPDTLLCHDLGAMDFMFTTVVPQSSLIRVRKDRSTDIASMIHHGHPALFTDRCDAAGTPATVRLAHNAIELLRPLLAIGPHIPRDPYIRSVKRRFELRAMHVH